MGLQKLVFKVFRVRIYEKPGIIIKSRDTLVVLVVFLYLFQLE